jgi:hypothetical protein
MIFTKSGILRPIVVPRYDALPVLIIKNVLRTAQWIGSSFHQQQTALRHRHREVFVRNAQFARGVSVHDVRRPHGLQFLRHAFAAHVSTARLKLESVAGDTRIVAAQNNVDRAQLQLHARFRVEVFARTAHRPQPTRFAAAHGHLKNGAARRVKIVQFFF